MLSYFVVGLLAYLSEASSRETMRPIPTITNSLVNLGKMEISLYFNESPAHHSERSARTNTPFFLQNQKSEPIIDEPCPCSNMRNIKNSFLSNPTGLLNKILTHNDLFSFNKNPVTSTLCCESHEQESTVVFEVPNNYKNMKPFASRSNTISIKSNGVPISNNDMTMPIMPYLFDTLIPNKSMLSPLKTKSVEIFLFPKKKDVKNLLPKKKDLILKDNIQIVGDKELKNDIQFFKPALPVIKKDLDLQEKKERENKVVEQEKQKEKEEIKNEGEQIIIEPASKPNAV